MDANTYFMKLKMKYHYKLKNQDDPSTDLK